MASTKIFPGTYNRSSQPSLLPKNVWMGLTTEVLNNSDGSVRIRLHVDTGNGVWWLIFDTVDDGRYGGAPFTAAGYGGLRSDFMDVDFDHFLFRSL